MRIDLDRAVQVLRKGGIVAIPTETVYGLAACIDHPEAIERIFALKKRPRNNPLIVHLASKSELQTLAAFTGDQHPHVSALVENFWPGPMTLILPAREGRLAPSVRAGLATAGFRVPHHPLALALLRQTGPLVAPSANLSGRPSATCLEHVELDFGNALPVLDGGECRGGIESTILGWHNAQLQTLRLGALTREAVQSALQLPQLRDDDRTDLPCPGRHHRHYAPRTRLHATLKDVPAPFVVIGFSDRQYPSSARVISLGKSRDDVGAARRLFAALRHLDALGISDAFVDLDIPNGGLWPAIAERLWRATQGNEK